MQTQKQETMREAMNMPRSRKPVLMIALAAVALFASSTTAKAQQDNSPVDPDVRCAAKSGPGQYEFYLPGAKVKDINGKTWVCGPDGNWFLDYSALSTSIITVGIRSRTYVGTAVLGSATIR